MPSDLELEEEEQRERGLSSEERGMRRCGAFGNPALIGEQLMQPVLERARSFARDLKYGFRGMGRNAGLLSFAILIVGLGIGGASTVFSVVNALLLRPLSFSRSGAVGMDSQWLQTTALKPNTIQTCGSRTSILDLAAGPFYSAGDKIDRDRRAGAPY